MNIKNIKEELSKLTNGELETLHYMTLEEQKNRRPRIYRDGGTYTFIKDGKTYYVDRRIGSKTRNKVYDRYPGDPDSKIVKIKPPEM
jgi:hypothetical protein